MKLKTIALDENNIFFSLWKLELPTSYYEIF